MLYLIYQFKQKAGGNRVNTAKNKMTTSINFESVLILETTKKDSLTQKLFFSARGGILWECDESTADVIIDDNGSKVFTSYTRKNLISDLCFRCELSKDGKYFELFAYTYYLDNNNGMLKKICLMDLAETN